jgi:hypothetical protein
MKVIVPIKEQEVLHYRNFIEFLSKYEDVSARSQSAGVIEG